MSTPPRRPLGPGTDVPVRPAPDPWAKTAAGRAAAGEWLAATPPPRPPAPRAGRRALGDGPADPGTSPRTSAASPRIPGSPPPAPGTVAG